MTKRISNCETCDNEMEYGGIDTIKKYCSKGCRQTRKGFNV